MGLLDRLMSDKGHVRLQTMEDRQAAAVGALVSIANEARALGVPQVEIDQAVASTSIIQIRRLVRPQRH